MASLAQGVLMERNRLAWRKGLQLVLRVLETDTRRKESVLRVTQGRLLSLTGQGAPRYSVRGVACPRELVARRDGGA
eukprot:COSAG01_NODE_1511_length_10068_cov_7.643731_15_plen_77_part_00